MKIESGLLLLSQLLFLNSARAQFCSFSLGNDTVICQGVPINFNLKAPTGANSYLWDNATTTATRQINGYGTFYCRLTKNGSNIVSNANFSLGNTGFTSGYTLGASGSSTWGLVGNPGTYAITTNASLVHSNFPSFTNHTAGGGNMMVVNGASNPNISVWCQNIPVTPNTNYNFSTWVATCVASNTSELAILQFSINGSVIGNPFSPSLTSGLWTQFSAQWNSGSSTTAAVCIVNQNVTPSGNDFAIDDIFFQPICVFTDTLKVISENFPSAYTAGADASICSGESYTLQGNQGTANSFSWTSIPPGFSANSIAPAVAPIDTTLYLLIASNNGCIRTDTMQLSVTPSPSPNAGLDEVVCNGSSLILKGNAGGGNSISWSSQPSGFTSSVVNPTFTPQLTSDLILTTANGNCVGSDTVHIIVETSPIVKFSYITTDSSCNGYSILLNNQTTDALTYLWDFGDGTASSLDNPLHTYAGQGLFQLKLTAENNGCESSKIFPLNINFSENTLFIPNSFTPNNDDNNDVFKIPPGCLGDFNVSLYNRWGELIHEWKGSKGFWDGKINGKNAPEGVYVYILEGNFLNGNLARKKGSITLYR